LEEWEEREGREKREGRKMAAILVPMAVQRMPLIARRCIAFTFTSVY